MSRSACRGYVAGQVYFELKLPTTTWQGRCLQSGCGGYRGAIQSPDFPACDVQFSGDFALAAAADEQLLVDFRLAALDGGHGSSLGAVIPRIIPCGD